MLSIRWLLVSFLPLLAILIPILHFRLFSVKRPILIDGHVQQGLEEIRKTFSENFERGWEREGASLTVYKNGEKLVDLWGGYEDFESSRPWKEDTLSPIFSTTKAVTAICVAMLVDRGKIRYEAPIAEYWPEFGKNGKQGITILQVLNHQAGLAYFEAEVSELVAANHTLMRELIENEWPKWEPGSVCAYHAFTMGWLIDHLFRQVDGRSVGQFFGEEIAEKHGIDLYIGLPKSEFYRMARASIPGMGERLDEIVTDYRVARYLRNYVDTLNQNSPLWRVIMNPWWLEAIEKCTFNNPDYLAMEQPASSGTGNARSLAKLFDLAFTGGLLSKAIVERIREPLVTELDLVVLETTPRGYGFFHFEFDGTAIGFGHTGHGCQHVQYDPINRVSVAYVSNGLKTGVGKYCRTLARLQEIIYRSLHLD